MRRWFGTVFARVFLVQGALALLVAVLFGVFAIPQLSQSQARVTAPIWAAALAPVVQHQVTLPQDTAVPSSVRLLPGPPPDGAKFISPLFPRYRALVAALRARGIPVVAMRVSGRTGEAITWLEIGQDGQTQWVGVRGELEGIDLYERGTLGFLIGLLSVLIGAWWLSRRVLRPVSDLRWAMRRFESEGALPPPVPANAPLELRELSQQFTALARQRLDLDEKRRTMLAAISHDLRSPLSRIRLAADLLPEAHGVEEWREAIVRNVQVAESLLGSFIDMARTDDEPVNERIELCALVRDLANTDADVQVIEVPAQQHWLQPANAQGLERALRNLLDNARHYGAEPIEMGLQCDDRATVLWVRDHGPGIEPGLREDMLQPFVRGESNRLTPGTGLGLAIAQRVAIRHGGQLLLRDATPGLRVELRLPRCETGQ